MSPRASWKRIRYSHARNLFGFIAYSSRCTIGSLRRYLCTRVGAQILSLGRPFEGRPVASKGLGPLPTMRGVPWPMAVAGVAAWCCGGWRGRPPCGPA